MTRRLRAPFPYFSISNIDAPARRDRAAQSALAAVFSRAAREFLMANKIGDHRRFTPGRDPAEVVLRGNRVEEFDFESASKRPLRGNIYLAKVTRVEPSLQAASHLIMAGNRHGFLAFSEIHPDYHQIPVARDRQALLEEEALSHREADEEANVERRSRRHRQPRRPEVRSPLRERRDRFGTKSQRMSFARKKEF